ncbi:MAG: hypothetical protein R3B09_34625 [Nannocystaceae bacterium]
MLRPRTLCLALAVGVGVALALPLASARAGDLWEEAQRLESESSFAAAAELWEELIGTATTPDEREVAAFRAQQARRIVAASTGDTGHLCRARSIVARFLARADLEEDSRRDFEGFAEEIGRALVDLGERCEPRPEPTPPVAEASTQGELGPEPPPAVAPISADRSKSSGKALAISGGVLVGAGAALVGLMTYGITVDNRAAGELLPYVSKNEATGLTMDEAADAAAIKHRGDVGSQLAIAAGVSGGAAIVAGVTLLVVKAVRDRGRRSGVALHPTLDPRSAGVVLRGSF